MKRTARVLIWLHNTESEGESKQLKFQFPLLVAIQQYEDSETSCCPVSAE